MGLITGVPSVRQAVLSSQAGIGAGCIRIEPALFTPLKTRQQPVVPLESYSGFGALLRKIAPSSWRAVAVQPVARVQQIQILFLCGGAVIP